MGFTQWKYTDLGQDVFIVHQGPVIIGPPVPNSAIVFDRGLAIMLTNAANEFQTIPARTIKITIGDDVPSEKIIDAAAVVSEVLALAGIEAVLIFNEGGPENGGDQLQNSKENSGK